MARAQPRVQANPPVVELARIDESPVGYLIGGVRSKSSFDKA